MSELILASKSPRRKEILKALGLSFRVIPSCFDELSIQIKDPRKLAKRLSYEKAQVIKTKFPDSIIIGADCFVVFKDKIIGKPKDSKDAFQILSRLSGNTHYVYGAITFIGKRTQTDLVITSVKFKKLSGSDIKHYLKTFKPYDKAGAYTIQQGDIVESFEGSYTNIIGISVESLKPMLKKEGIIINTEKYNLVKDGM